MIFSVAQMLYDDGWTDYDPRTEKRLAEMIAEHEKWERESEGVVQWWQYIAAMLLMLLLLSGGLIALANVAGILP